MADRNEEIARLDRCLAQLSDHYDSIQIIATRHEGTRTISADRGTGNWHSRFGAVSEWVERERARVWAQVERDDDEREVDG